MRGKSGFRRAYKKVANEGKRVRIFEIRTKKKRTLKNEY